MKSNLKFFKNSKELPLDNFFGNVLYDKKFGYYSRKNPFGKEGDFITSPGISNLFSEMVAIWIVATWEMFGKPKILNLVELGPGDGSLTKKLLSISKRFPKFDSAKKIYLYEKSNFLKEIQKKNLKNFKVKWVNNFNKIKNGPIIFFGNEFFDALPIKQFKRDKKNIYEKYLKLGKNYKIQEFFKSAKLQDIKIIQSYKILNNLKNIEFPKSGFKELKKVTKSINRLNGCVLLIDYGYFKPHNQNTMQSVMKNKKNNLYHNLGKADVTAHVNFSLLREFLIKNNLKVKKIVYQKDYLNNLGILKRADIIAKNMKFREQANLYLRLKRLLDPKMMGELFKVILAFKFKNSNFLGFN